MRSLFLRIFLGFWLTVTLAGAIVGLLAYMSRPQQKPIVDSHLQFIAKGLDGYAREALNTLESGGVEGWKAHLREIKRSEPRPFLVTRKGKTLSGRPLPPPAVDMAEKVFESGETQARRNFPVLLLARPLDLPGEGLGALVVQLKFPKPPRKDIERLLPHHFRIERLLIFLAVGGIVCFLLTRSLTSPIRKLRKATNQFASGDLSTRVGDGITGKNEIADLGRDFDFMAERIEGLVSAQKRLLRDISHELRSPLARLGVALELARQRAGEEASKPLDRIEKESELLNEMIGQLLSLTLLESGTEEMRKENFDLGALVREVASDADFEARGRSRSVLFKEAEEIPFYGSRELLRRAIENVVRNAARYTEEGTAVEVALEKEGNQVAIRVRDHGHGVPEEALERIFEPFYRVALARDRRSGGTGIGLAITDRAVRLHGGRVRANNADGGGLVVTMELPTGPS